MSASIWVGRTLGGFLGAVSLAAAIVSTAPQTVSAAPTSAFLEARANGQPMSSGGSTSGSVVLYGFAYSDTGASPSSVSVSLKDSAGAIKNVAARLHLETKALLAAASAADELLNPAASQALARAGWMAAIDQAIVAAGDWSAVSVLVTFPGSSSPVAIDFPTPFAFTIQDSGAQQLSQLKLVARPPFGAILSAGNLPNGVSMETIGGAPVPVATVTAIPFGAGRGQLVLRSYPALPSGDYDLMLPGVNPYGLIVTTPTAPTTFRYQRNVVNAYVDSPEINDPSYASTSGMTSLVAISDPLVDEQIVVPLAARAVSSGTNLTLDFDVASRKHIVRNAALTGTGQTLFWLNAPDAPDLSLSNRPWNPADAIVPGWKEKAITAELETTSWPTTWVAAKRGGCVAPLVFVGVTNSNDVPLSVIPINTPLSQVFCAVRWSSPPPSLQLPARSMALAGTLSLSAAGQALSHDVGIVFYDQTSSRFVFSKSQTRTTTLNVVDQVQPVATFVADASIRNVRGVTGLATLVGENRGAGVMQLAGAVPGAEFSTHVVGTVAAARASYRARSSVPIATTTTASGQATTVTVESWWNATPERKYSYDLSFVSIPATPTLQLVTATDTLTTKPMVFRAIFGVASGRTVSYTPVVDGVWTIAAQVVDSTGAWETIGAVPSSSVSASGEVQITSSAPQSRGSKYYRLVATLNDNAALAATTVATPGQRFTIQEGTPMNGAITASAVLGPASVRSPFVVTLRFVLDDATRRNDIASVLWQYSDDGGTNWRATPDSGSTLTQSITETVDRLYRATVTSLYLPQPFEANTLRIVTFTPPTVTIAGPTGILLGQTAPYTLTAGGVNGGLTHTWTAKGLWVNPPTYSGDGEAFTFTPSTVGTYEVKVESRQVDAPNDPRSITSTRSRLVVSAPIVPSLPRIVAPVGVSSFEQGATYAFTAVTPVLPASFAAYATQVRMKWILPSGQELPAVDGASVSTSFTTDKRVLTLKAWVDGYEGEARSVEFVAQIWTYAFPEYTIRSSTPAGWDAPVTLDLAAQPGIAPRLDPGSAVTVVWTLPAGAGTVVSATGMNARIQLTQPGSQVISVELTDARGDKRTSSLTVLVTPQKLLDFSLTPIASDDQFGRAPLAVTVPIRINSTPKDDAMASLLVEIDGATVYRGQYIPYAIRNFALPTPGTHQLSATVTTRGGESKTVTQSLNVIVGATPVCSVARAGAAAATLILDAVCSVSMGTVRTYEWRVNDSAYVVGRAARIMLTPGSVTMVSLTACPDRGPCTNATWTP